MFLNCLSNKKTYFISKKSLKIQVALSIVTKNLHYQDSTKRKKANLLKMQSFIMDIQRNTLATKSFISFIYCFPRKAQKSIQCLRALFKKKNVERNATIECKRMDLMKQDSCSTVEKKRQRKCHVGRKKGRSSLFS